MDTNTTTAGSGSTNVTWGAASGAYWTTDGVNGTTNPVAWNSVTGATTAKNATFSAGTNATGIYTVTVSGIVDYIGGLTFEEGSVTLAAGTLNLRQTSLVNVAAAQATISSAISSTSGVFGLTKTGTGLLTLSGANTYTGPTAIQNGTLSINTIANVSGGASALGAPTTAANGTIKIGSTTTAATLKYTGATASSNRVISLAGTTGGATIDASGSGALTLTSAFTATGAGSKTLSLIGTNTANNTISGAIVNNSSTNKTSLYKDGAGTWLLSGNSSYTGATTVNLGTLKIGATGSGGNGPLGTTAAGTTVNSGGALDLNGFTLANAEALNITGSGVNSTGALTNSSGSASTFSGITTLGGDATIGGTGNIALTAGITDAGTARTLTKAGTNTLALNAAAGTWTANNNVVVNGGTLQAGITNALGSSALSNITVNATTAGTTANFALGNSVNQSIASLTFGGSGATSTSTNNVTIGTSSTLTLGGNVTYDATNNPLGSTVSGGSLSVGAANRTFTIGDSSNATTDLTVSSVVTGTAGVVKAGAGTLAFSGTNTYGGATTINGGTLSISSLAGLGNSSTAAANLVLNGGALQYTGATASSSRLFTLGTSGGTIDASGSGALTLSTTGTVATSGSGTRTLTFGGSSTATNSFIGVVADGTGGATSIVKSGTGTWLFDGNNANTYTGGTTILGGTLQLSKKSGRDAAGAGDIYIGNGSASATLAYTDTANQLNNSTSVFISDNGTFDTNGRSDSLETIGDGASVTNRTGRILLTGTGGNATLTLTSAVTNTQFSGVISGAGSLSQTGASTLTLAGANTYSGTTTLSAGTLNLNNASALGTSTFSIAGGTFDNTSGTAITLSTNNAQTWGSAINFTGSNDLNLGTGAVAMNSNTTVTVGGNILTVGGVISGGGSTLTKMGTGSLTLAGANSYSGVTTVSQGTLSVGADALSGSAGALGNATSAVVVNNALTGSNNTALTIATSGVTIGRAVTVANSGTGTTALGGDTSLTSGTGTFTGNIALGRSATIQAAGTSNITFGSGIISGAGGLTKTGTGTVTLSGANTYTGTTTVSQGTIALESNAPSASSGALGNASSAVVLNDASTGANNTGLTISTSGVTVGRALTVANSGSGTTTLGGATALATGTGSFTGNILLNKSTTLQAAGSSVVTFSTGVISGTGAISKSGTGTVVLSGNNVYGGGTTVTDGVLNVQSQNALGTGNITVNSGGSLQLQGGTTATVQGSTLLTLNGTGYGGIGALNNLSGANLWNNGIVLGSDATISNSAISGATNQLSLGPVDSSKIIDLQNHRLTFGGTGDVLINSNIGTVGDTGGITIDGTGTVTLFGYQNFYTGTTNVNSGTLLLYNDIYDFPNKSILGNLVIGDGTGSANTATVTTQLNDMIADTVAVTINKDGRLDLSTHFTDEYIGSLTLNGGHVDTGNGNLYIGGIAGTYSVATSASTQTALIDGHLSMAGHTTTFSVANGGLTSDLTVNAIINEGSLIKDGLGVMTVTSDNTNGYVGTTEVKNGILDIQHGHALGGAAGGAAASGTTVDSGATLRLEGANITSANPEALILNGSGYGGIGALNSQTGTNGWAGAITLGSSSLITNQSATAFALSGGVTGAATNSTVTFGGTGTTTVTSNGIQNGTGTLSLVKQDSGTLNLMKSSTFTGAITVTGGTLNLGVTAALNSNVNTVQLNSGTTMTVAGGAGTLNRIAALTGAGTVSIASGGTLVVNTASADTFDGKLSSTGLFEKAGAGTFTFSSTANTSAFNFAGTVQLTAAATTDTLEFRGGSSGNALSIGTLKLTGGTLLLTNSFINVGTLNITGDTILDFGTSGASTLNATNIYITAGAKLTVVNWDSEVDFLFANSDFRQNNSSGTIAVQNAINTSPENQVWFQGNTQSPTGAATTWIDNATNYYSLKDNEIRPVPEPATYGLIFLGTTLSFLGWRRRKS